MISYQREMLADALAELKPLLPLHWVEIASNHDAIPLDPNYDRYLAVERAGGLHFYTMRKAGELVGYHISFIEGHLHYKSTLHCIVDIYYLRKEYRGHRLGLKFFLELEVSLRKLGVKKIFTGCKVREDIDHSKFFEGLGYSRTDYLYAKILT